MTERSDKDLWDKFETIFKTFIVLLVTTGIGIYTFRVSENNRQEQAQIQEKNRNMQIELQEDNRAAQTLIQMMNARETAMSSLRTSMFSALLDHFLKEDDVESQIVMLEMIGLNFHDSIQIKPMFERLDRKLDNDSNPSFTLRVLLRDAARTIIYNQLGQIQLTDDGNFCKFSLHKGESINPECLNQLELKLIDVLDDHILVRTNTKDGQFVDFKKLRETDEGEIDPTASDFFSVTYFDMPMIDYTQVNSDVPIRYSVVLLEVEPDKATIAVSMLPTADFSADNRYLFDEKVQEILNPVERNMIQAHN